MPFPVTNGARVRVLSNPTNSRKQNSPEEILQPGDEVVVFYYDYSRSRVWFRVSLDSLETDYLPLDCVEVVVFKPGDRVRVLRNTVGAVRPRASLYQDYGLLEVGEVVEVSRVKEKANQIFYIVSPEIKKENFLPFSAIQHVDPPGMSYSVGDVLSQILDS